MIVGGHLVEGRSILANTLALWAQWCLCLEVVVMGPTTRYFHRVDIKAAHFGMLTQVDLDFGWWDRRLKMLQGGEDNETELWQDHCLWVVWVEQVEMISLVDP